MSCYNNGMWRHPLTLALVAGTSLGIATWHPWLWWLVFPGLVLTIHTIVRTETYGKRLWHLFIIGSLKGGGATIFFWYIYPYNWIGIDSALIQLAILLVCWTTVAAAIGLGHAIVLATYSHSSTSWSPQLAVSVFPIILVVAEAVGSLFFSLYSLGPGSSPNLHFAYGYVGYAISYNSLLASTAQFGGVYMLSALAGAGAALLYTLWKLPSCRRIAFLCLVLLVTFVAIPVLLQEKSAPSGTTVITIDTRFAADQFTTANGRQAQERHIKDAVEAALKYQPDYVVLPEDSRFTLNFKTPTAALTFLQGHTSSTVLVDSTRTDNAFGETILRAYMYDTSRGETHSVDKEYLVPSGEFIPYLTSILLNQFAGTSTIATIESRLAYRSGHGELRSSVPKEIPHILFCSESVSPTLTARRYANRPSAFTAHLVSHGWFNNPVILHHQTRAILRVQAIWSVAPIIMASNMSAGYLTTASGDRVAGTVLEETPQWTVVHYEL
jgi:apolipoprotein N-acyltransferase